MRIHVCLTEGEIGEEFFRSLKKGRLEERFFYWFPLSVLSWLRLCRSSAYPNYARSLSLAKKFSSRLAREIRAFSVQWVSLGAGQGTKEIPFLEALRKAKKTLRYFPVDSSQVLLESAVAQGAKRGIPTLGFKADFENPAHWEKVPRPAKGEIEIVSLLGNSLGNFNSKGLFALLRRRMRRGDLLVVDGEIFRSAKETLAGYDHPVNRRFALAPLHSIGVSEKEGMLRFKLGNARPRGVWRLSKSFHFTKPKKIFYAGQFLFFRKGAALPMSPSYKYTPSGMKKILEKGGAFRVRKFYKSPDGRFGLWVAERT